VAGIETGRIIPGRVNRNKGWFHPNHVLEEGDPRLLDVVRGAGIEPARGFPHRILSIIYSISRAFQEVLKSYI